MTDHLPNENPAENPDAKRQNATGTVAEEAKTSSEQPPAPVRMKWGRVVEDPSAPAPSQPIPAAKQSPGPVSEESPAVKTPRVDPRFEALRKRMEQQNATASPRTQTENAEPNTEPSIEETAAETSEHPPVTRQSSERTRRSRKSAPSSEVRSVPHRSAASENESQRRNAPSAEQTGRQQNQDALRLTRERARIAEEAARAKAFENAQMREELEQIALRRALKKQKRKETFSEFGAFLVGGIGSLFLGLFRWIRASKKAILAIFVTLVLAVILAVILGNVLRQRVDLGQNNGGTSTAETTEEREPPLRDFTVPKLNAAVVFPEGATKRTLQTEARRFASAGMTSVSLLMRREDGSLLFASQTDNAFGENRPDDGTLLPVSELIQPFLDEGLYVSCLFSMHYGMEEDSYTRPVLFAYESALIREIADAGANEVVLLDLSSLLYVSEEETLGSAATVSEAVEELSALAYRMQTSNAETAVGIALNRAFLNSRESDRYLSTLAAAYDFTLLDLRDCGDDISTVANAITEHLYFILRYEMRVLIPSGTAEGAMRAEVHDWQEGTLPKETASEENEPE